MERVAPKSLLPTITASQRPFFFNINQSINQSNQIEMKHSMFKPHPQPNKLDIKLGNRLYFVEHNGRFWPAVRYNDFDEFLNHLQDEIDDLAKPKIALTMINLSCMDIKIEGVLRLLGKPASDFVVVEQGKVNIRGYVEILGHVLNHQCKKPDAFDSTKDYLEFCDALTESQILLMASYEGASRPTKTPRQRADEILAEANQGQQQMMESSNHRSTNEAFAANVKVDSVLNQPSKDHEMTDTTPAMSAPPAHDEEMAEASTESMTHLPEDRHLQVASRGKRQSESRTLATTPTTNNRSYASSSATVVSDATPEAHEEEIAQYELPEELSISQDQTVEEIGQELVMAGWDRDVVNGETLYCLPNMKVESAIRGKHCFAESELIDFCRQNNLFKKKYIGLREGDNANKHTMTSLSTDKKKKTNTLTKASAKKPIRGKPTNAKGSSKKSKAKPFVKSKKKSTKTPYEDTCCQPRRSSRGKYTEEKYYPFKDDPFYQFKPLIKELQEHLGWDYKFGPGVETYTYIRGDSNLKRHGVRGVDFFHKEEEVLEYCYRNNYKKKYWNKFMKTPVKKTPAKKTPHEKVDPNFVTPPPTRNRRIRA
jgi:hypothetical protein